jgi:hypothetical protein
MEKWENEEEDCSFNFFVWKWKNSENSSKFLFVYNKISLINLWH